MATARAKARERRRWKECRPTTKDVTKMFYKYCDAVNKVVKERIDAMWDAGLSEAIRMVQQAQLEDNRKCSQEIDNLDMTVTPKLIYPHSPSIDEIALMHAGLNYRKVVTREELEEEYPSK